MIRPLPQAVVSKQRKSKQKSETFSVSSHKDSIEEKIREKVSVEEMSQI